MCENTSPRPPDTPPAPVDDQHPMNAPYIGWCPLMNAPCRKDCMWVDTVVIIDEKGMSQEHYCAVTMIASSMLNVDENGWERGLYG